MGIKILELLEEATNLLVDAEKEREVGRAKRGIWSAQVLATTALAYALMNLNDTIRERTEDD